MDFVADNLFGGRKLRTLTVDNCYTLEILDIHVDKSLKGEDVVRVQNHIVAIRGKPNTIKTDNELNAIGVTTKRQSSSRLQFAVKNSLTSTKSPMATSTMYARQQPQ
jgi:hypothetical protein